MSEERAPRRSPRPRQESRGQERSGDERLARRVASLSRELRPSRDLWPGIEARIAARRQTPRPRAGWLPTVPAWAWWTGTAAACLALLLIALPVVLEWSASRGASPVPGDLTALAWQARQEDDVFGTRQGLEMVLGAAKATGSLSPEAAADVERGLRTLDRAIGETRAALDRNPDDPRLRRLLAERYRQEALLLHRIQSL